MADTVKRVFLSSTVGGLSRFRDAAAQAIDRLDQYKCVRMETFPASQERPIDLCLRRLSQCDIYVAIVGHSYGTYVPGLNQSYTEMEYEAAVNNKIPALVFMASEDLPIAANEIDDDVKRERQRAFRDRVSNAHVGERFTTEAELSVAVIAALQATPSAQEPTDRECGSGSTELLFPFVTNQAGYDTGITISNTTARPRETRQKRGVCSLYYFGSTPGSLTPAKQVSAIVEAGDHLVFLLSTGGSHGLFATPGFQGYIIAECNFPQGRGFAFITDGPGNMANVGAGYLAEIVKEAR